MLSNNELYRRLSLVRQAEQKIVEVYASDVMQCPVHLSIGQESIAVALCAHLRKDDLKIGTHRSHGLYLANGGDLTAFYGELMGRKCGCSGGMGGSMHLIDLANGLVGTSSIVGGALPISVGLAMSLKRPSVSAVLFGDGACDEGVFAESLNFARLRSLPVIFLCENNRYSVYTPDTQRRAVVPSEIAKAFGMETIYIPIEKANDVFVLYELLAGPIAGVRAGGGPLFVECQTVRRFDHNGIRDDIAAGFRPASEMELYEKYCPVKLARAKMNPAQADAMDHDVRASVEAAYARALAAPEAILEFSKS